MLLLLQGLFQVPWEERPRKGKTRSANYHIFLEVQNNGTEGNRFH